MRLTVPQIIMLNHAAWYNQKRIEYSIEQKYGKQGERMAIPEEQPTYNGKPIDELDSNQWASYFNNWSE